MLDVDASLRKIGATTGPGRRRLGGKSSHDLFARATEPEQRFLARLLTGELRQGALEGVMVDAVARAAGVPARDVRRAVMLAGDLGTVAAAAIDGRQRRARELPATLLTPVQPMLAQSADSIRAAFERIRRGGGRVEARRRPHPGPSAGR